jgi:hypothetical protein
MMNPARNVHISPTPVTNKSRILKQTSSVARSGLFSEVTLCGKAQADLPRTEHLDEVRTIERVGALRTGRKSSVLGRIADQVSWSMAVYRKYRRSDASVVNAHSVAVLPVCYFLSRRLGAKLIYDTHELETEAYACRGAQRIIFKLAERLLISKCDAVFVVNQSIADWYREHYEGLEPVVIRNIPDAQQVTSSANIRQMLSVPEDKLLFIHTGSLVDGRNIPAILDAFASPGVGAHVVFLGDDGTLGALVSQYCADHPNIHRLPPVPPAHVPSFAASCDAGLCLIQIKNLSYRMSLSNKALEYITAGIPLFFTDLPEVSRLLGPAFDSWQVMDPARDLARAIAALTADEVREARARIAKLDLPTWDDEAEGMIAAYLRLLPSGWQVAPPRPR